MYKEIMGEEVSKLDIGIDFGIELSTALIPGGTAGKKIVKEAGEAVIRSAANGGVTIIGEGMKRVSMEATKHAGSIILNKIPKFIGTSDQITSQMMTYNRQWMLQQMRSGRPIIDIGIDPMRINPSIFYQMEQNMLKNYQILHPNSLNIVKP
jgi:hypothetical protein